MNRVSGLVLFLLLPLFSFCQKVLSGSVTDAETKQPLPGASVFLSNTSIGTTANSRGEFTLQLPAGRYDLVVSAVDHETYSSAIAPDTVSATLHIKLRPRAKEMATVVIQSFEKNGWKTWGQFFIDNFIGTSQQAGRCGIKNKETLRFRLDKAKNKLFVLAREPLIIENKALGYRIRYQLEEFSFDFDSRVVSYLGYPFFEELEGGAGRTHRWAKARRVVYQGSTMHFMRALFQNKLEQEGFSMYSLRRIPNTKRIRSTKKVNSATIYELTNGTLIRCDLSADTIRAYQSFMGAEFMIGVTTPGLASADSVVYAGNDKTAVLDFTDYLMVVYDKGNTPDEYRKTVRNNDFRMLSEITLINGRPISIEGNGVYYDPLDLLTNGWWAWSEKIGMMLPFDYQPL